MDERAAVEGLTHKAKERKLENVEFFKKVKEGKDSDELVWQAPNSGARLGGSQSNSSGSVSKKK